MDVVDHDVQIGGQGARGDFIDRGDLANEHASSHGFHA